MVVVTENAINVDHLSFFLYQQDRISREEEAATRAGALEEENRDLVSRIIHLKDQEADRMNEMNRLRDEIVRFEIIINVLCIILR